MQVQVSATDILHAKTDVAVYSLFEGTRKLSPELSRVDAALNGSVLRMLRSRELTGKKGETATLHTLGLLPAKKVILVGLGKSEALGAENIRRSAAEAVRAANSAKARSAVFSLLGHGANFSDEDLATLMAEGAALAAYQFAIRKEEKKPRLGKATLAVTKEQRDSLKAAAEKGAIFARGTNLARDLANASPQDMYPDQLAARALTLAEENGLECQVFDEHAIQEMGMNAFYAVGKGSERPPRLICLKYVGADDSPAIGLVGKGVTFDSGGLSLKTADGMAEMKGDMSGAAAVLAAMQAIAQLQPRVNVTMLIPAVENVPSSKSYKPGDILTAMNGKTIEVLNTDAEGRLLLADTLCYAEKLGLSPIIDLATLTGACMIALGPICTGAFSNNPDLVKQVIAAGRDRGEPIWHMPLAEYEDYAELIKSDFADIKNTGGRPGGAITAACFLQHFVEDTPWCHLDIAPTMASSKDQHHISKGMTGVGARTCVQFALDRAGKVSPL